ncbi:MAG: hypothetical protein QOI46_5120, partial [Alphaproteobacteria bacterium]|nr:hypothetical protein [Alphaproteobacteria bacterium]
MLNADVVDLYSRADVGTKIIVLPNYQNVADFARRFRVQDFGSAPIQQYQVGAICTPKLFGRTSSN